MKSGFVSLIGHPNVGKSTIINLLSDKKVSIVTSKAQTTRNNIISIIDSKDYQIIITDTPGLHNPRNVLSKSMNKKVYDAIDEADINVLVVSSKEDINEENFAVFLKKKIDIIVLNKIDLARLPEINVIKEKINKLFSKSLLIEMSAKDGFNKGTLLNEIIIRLKKGPKYYPDVNVIKDDIFYTKEIIREKILKLLKEEVPHNIAIYLKDIRRKKESVYIIANIIVNKESQKGIVIGKKGTMLKKIGTLSRKDLEEYFKKRIFLEIHVKVKEDWINSAKDIKEFGY